MTTTPAIRLAVQVGQREWKGHLFTQLCTLPLWYGFALGVFDLHDVLRFSWIALGLLAAYLYRSITKSHLVALLPITHHDAWIATSLVAAAVPALIQVAIGLLMLALVPDYGRDLLGRAPSATMVVLGGLYTAGFLQIALSVPAPAGRLSLLHTALVIFIVVGLFLNAHVLPASLGEFTPLSAGMALSAAFLLVSRTMQVQLHPGRSLERPAHNWRFAPPLATTRLADRLTGIQRILVVQLAFGTFLFGTATVVVLWVTTWIDGTTMSAATLELLAPFSTGSGWIMRPGDSFLFTPMWVIGFTSIWIPFARQLRILPLSPLRVTTAFLALPVLMWLVVWAIFVALYITFVGTPASFRLDAMVAGAGTTALANTLSWRWQNRLYGMVGMGLIYGFWGAMSIAVLVFGNPRSGLFVSLIGVVFLAAAVWLCLHTVRHANSGSAAYQRRPKFFDTPARG